jgi:hypothetical protein
MASLGIIKCHFGTIKPDHILIHEQCVDRLRDLAPFPDKNDLGCRLTPRI